MPRDPGSTPRPSKTSATPHPSNIQTTYRPTARNPSLRHRTAGLILRASGAAETALNPFAAAQRAVSACATGRTVVMRKAAGSPGDMCAKASWYVGVPPRALVLKWQFPTAGARPGTRKESNPAPRFPDLERAK
ncbi:hypothetical protein EJ06DRAFT_518844 [Trichodelitschia bisporula]|uniref:Uncharacterized protein n=1 Tax=Trichodelitschia bisporula TaxID=703511 RepID=A0A6G1I850_9PEZI|nr:hypothetical protein EJ06DRAFT_518844 [Trichodelitschia bisporula]